MEEMKIKSQLPENAFRELKEGEKYEPLMAPGGSYPEVNAWSVTWGVLMAMLFSAAAAYLGLKVGQVFEAAIPIAIIAVGVSTAAKRSRALGENVIIQSIGACSGAVVAGAIFTLPAIYILQAKYPEMSASFLNIFFASLLGGIIGILFLIPFRKYFVSDMHGKYPFPEATATTQVLVSVLPPEEVASPSAPEEVAPPSAPEGATIDPSAKAKEAPSGAVGGAIPSGAVGGATTLRTERDLPFRFIAIASAVTILVTFLFFWFGVMDGNMLQALVAIVLVAVIAFLFTTVAANAIAIVGSNPVSGMTLMTLILASVVMVGVGLSGTSGMVAALVMGGVVCTALSMAGAFITDLKIGYWLGSTPRKQESWKFLGTLVSAATVGGVMMLLNETYGFASGQLAAPQANAMAAVIDPLMNGVGAPWTLYAIGAVLAVVLTLCKVPALPFALGMFIPLELNTPLLVGGAINWYVTTRSKNKAENDARGEKGTLIASGFIAGGALMGVVSALLRFGGFNPINDAWLANPLSEVCALAAYILLIIYFVWATKKAK